MELCHELTRLGAVQIQMAKAPMQRYRQVAWTLRMGSATLTLKTLKTLL